MKPDEFRAVIDTLGTAVIAERAGTMHRTVERARANGAVSRGQTGAAIEAAIKELSGIVQAPAQQPGEAEAEENRSAPKNNGTVQDNAETRRSMEAGLTYREERAKLTEQKRIREKRENAVLAGELIPKGEVLKRAKAAATELRCGHEAIARAIGHAAGENRDAVTEAFDHAYARMLERVVQAWSA